MPLMCDVLFDFVVSLSISLYRECIAYGKTWMVVRNKILESLSFPVRSCHQSISSTYAWCAACVSGLTSILLQDMANHSPAYARYLMTAHCSVVSYMSRSSDLKHTLVLRFIHACHKLQSHVCCFSANTLYVPAFIHQHVHTIATIKGSGYT